MMFDKLFNKFGEQNVFEFMFFSIVFIDCSMVFYVKSDVII
jgi:hypothetical protein